MGVVDASTVENIYQTLDQTANVNEEAGELQGISTDEFVATVQQAAENGAANQGESTDDINITLDSVLTSLETFENSNPGELSEVFVGADGEIYTDAATAPEDTVAVQQGADNGFIYNSDGDRIVPSDDPNAGNIESGIEGWKLAVPTEIQNLAGAADIDSGDMQQLVMSADPEGEGATVQEIFNLFDADGNSSINQDDIASLPENILNILNGSGSADPEVAAQSDTAVEGTDPASTANDPNMTSSAMSTEGHSATFISEDAGYDNKLYTYDLDESGMPTNFREVIGNSNTQTPGSDIGDISIGADGVPNLMLLPEGADTEMGIGNGALGFENGQLTVDGEAYPGDYFFSHDSSLSSDQADSHFKFSMNEETGQLTVAMEDLPDQFSDNDFNDMVIQIDGVENYSGPQHDLGDLVPPTTAADTGATGAEGLEGAETGATEEMEENTVETGETEGSENGEVTDGSVDGAGAAVATGIDEDQATPTKEQAAEALGLDRTLTDEEYNIFLSAEAAGMEGDQFIVNYSDISDEEGNITEQGDVLLRSLQHYGVNTTLIAEDDVDSVAAQVEASLGTSEFAQELMKQSYFGVEEGNHSEIYQEMIADFEPTTEESTLVLVDTNSVNQTEFDNEANNAEFESIHTVEANDDGGINWASL